MKRLLPDLIFFTVAFLSLCVLLAATSLLLGSPPPQAPPVAPAQAPPVQGHRCTCGCEVTGQCTCPNCSTGCGFLKPPVGKPPWTPVPVDKSESAMLPPGCDPNPVQGMHYCQATDRFYNPTTKQWHVAQHAPQFVYTSAPQFLMQPAMNFGRSNFGGGACRGGG